MSIQSTKKLSHNYPNFFVTITKLFSVCSKWLMGVPWVWGGGWVIKWLQTETSGGLSVKLRDLLQGCLLRERERDLIALRLVCLVPLIAAL